VVPKVEELPVSPTQIAQTLGIAVGGLTFSSPVTHVYNPLQYARSAHEQYMSRYARPGIQVLLVGMNPGPWGMAQTGVPFGEVAAVRDWLKIDVSVDKPPMEHPERPIEGFSCTRSEVSGRRLWGWARSRYRNPATFFTRFFVHNYCPLCFMEASGRNFTPDKLRRAEQSLLFEHCDTALRALTTFLRPQFVIGVGAFAEKRILMALSDDRIQTGRIAHPSPANPAANQGWEATVESQLSELGIIP